MADQEERILPAPVEEEMRTAYLDYSMSVIVNRALPDVRDGLKPVQRRILVAMNDLNLDPTRPYRKSAKITGDVNGNYHPHGTASIYDTMVRLAQDFSLRYTLVDGQGNFGSVDGDNAAAERYTEARLSRPAVEVLADLDKQTVDFRPNYENVREEPVVLPGRFPNLLCNGATGIAVGGELDLFMQALAELRSERDYAPQVLAVTGTNGKTTTTRCVAHLLQRTGKRVGMTCTDGIFIGGRRIDTGDCSGPKSARAVLGNPPDAPEMRAWRRILRPHDLFVDVGAHVGLYSIWALDAGATVIAAESDSFCLSRCPTTRWSPSSYFSSLQST